jgi:hypothetical protein
MSVRIWSAIGISEEAIYLPHVALSLSPKKTLNNFADCMPPTMNFWREREKRLSDGFAACQRWMLG